MSESDATVHQLVDNRSSNMWIAQSTDRVETLLVGAVPKDVGPFIATDYDRDIAWADGYFVSWPGQVN